MRKFWPLFIISVVLLSACSVFRLFKGKETSGCPTGRNVGAEKILARDEKAIKGIQKAGNNKPDKNLQ
jgi:hypothetical protein